MNKSTFIAALICLVSSSNCFAEWIDQHRCNEPFEDPFPNSFSETTYQLGAQSFKECIEKYIQDQDQAMDEHKEAAEHALKSWNDFVAKSNSRR